MPRHEYTKAHIPHRLLDELTAAGITPEQVGGDGTRVWVTVPDGVPKAAVDAVLAAHDVAAIAAAEAAQRREDEAIRSSVFAAATGAVGKNITALTTTERNALIAVLLWRWGALSPTLTIKALDEWAYAVTPERATP